jgi:EmrB/QacA subfamily drug resistance transporter
MTIEERAYARRWWILLVLCLSLVIITLDNTILNVALPTLVRDLHATNSELQWMVDSYTLVFAGLLLTAGSLGDRFGRKGALQIGLAVFALGSLASALANDPAQLIATRALMGIGGAFIMPATLSILTNVFPAEERGRAIGVWAGVSALGIAIGPLLGGYLIDHFSWGSIFTVNLPIAAVAIAAGGFLVPTSKDPSAPKLDPLGAALSIVGLVALVYGLIEAPSKGWGSPTIVGAFAVAVVVLGTFVWWELRVEEPMLDVSFFKNPRFTAASSAITLVFFAMFGFSFLLTQYFQFVLGYSAQKTGVYQLPLALTLMVVAPTSARVVERLGSKKVVAAGLFFVALALVLCTQLQVDTPYANIVWRMMLLALGMGMTMAPATESVMGSLPLAKAGVGSAVNDTTRQVGGALGVAIVGSVLSSVYGSKIVDLFSGKVPGDAVEAAKDSLGSALSVATKAGGSSARQLAAGADQAFVSAMHGGALVAAAAAAVGVVVVLLFLPARARAVDVEARRTSTRTRWPRRPPPATTSPSSRRRHGDGFRCRSRPGRRRGGPRAGAPARPRRRPGRGRRRGRADQRVGVRRPDHGGGGEAGRRRQGHRVPALPVQGRPGRGGLRGGHPGPPAGARHRLAARRPARRPRRARHQAPHQRHRPADARHGGGRPHQPRRPGGASALQRLAAHPDGRGPAPGRRPR